MKRTHMRSTHRRPRRGFSLTEVMMAMTLLSIVLLSLARMTMVVSLRGRNNDLIAKRNAVLTQEANKFGAMRWDTLAKMSTSKTMKAGDFSYTRTISITDASNRKTIKIVVTPTLDATKKDSVFVHRSKPPGSPLCVG